VQGIEIEQCLSGVIVLAGSAINEVPPQVVIDKKSSSFLRESRFGIPDNDQVVVHGERPDAVQRTFDFHLGRDLPGPYLGCRHSEMRCCRVKRQVEHPDIRYVIYSVYRDGTLTGGLPRMRHDLDCSHFDWGCGEILGTPAPATDAQMSTLKACTTCRKAL
jgi:hypothetical protein